MIATAAMLKDPNDIDREETKRIDQVNNAITKSRVHNNTRPRSSVKEATTNAGVITSNCQPTTSIAVQRISLQPKSQASHQGISNTTGNKQNTTNTPDIFAISRRLDEIGRVIQN